MEYASISSASPVMHPFFQRDAVHQRPQSHPLQHEMNSTPFPSTVQHSPPSYPPSAECRHHLMQTHDSTSPLPADDHAQYETHHADDGRKRRKVSLEPNLPLKQDTECSQLAEQDTWIDQLGDAEATPLHGNGFAAPADLDHNPVQQHVDQAFPPTPQPNVVESGASIEEPFRADVEIELQDQDPVVSSVTQNVQHTAPLVETTASASTPEDSSSSKDKQTVTPKRKSMRIGRNGKLTSSPQDTIQRSPKLHNKILGNKSTPIPEPKKSKTRARTIEAKKGRLVSSLVVAFNYQTPDLGKKIDEILSGRKDATIRSTSLTSEPQSQQKLNIVAKKAVHPFFSTKPAPKLPLSSLATSDLSSTAPTSEDETQRTSPKAPKSWKDIIFTSKRPLQKFFLGSDPIWPPLETHNVQPQHHFTALPGIPRPNESKFKSKQLQSEVCPEEDVLQRFQDVMNFHHSAPLHRPTRLVVSGKALSISVDCSNQTDDDTFRPSLESLESKILSRPTAFDRGMASDTHLWSQEYAPKRWQEVLQAQSRILYDWLITLQVHQVQSGQAQAKLKPLIQKKRRKRKSDEMDDFIAHSDDDEEDGGQWPKNAILLVGPPGSGKTASVYAVAQQLGFEVFELHPGMRRNTKDILDKVGDMTQNHLVQRAPEVLSRRSSISASDAESITPLPLAPGADQQGIAAFLGKDKQTRKKPLKHQLDTDTTNKDIKPRQQKQSLILFEEVDILFEDDKGFWSGVQSLIRTSKRPVVMTCNDPTSIPFDELDLFTILTYAQPAPDIAIEYLHKVAAAEGHLLEMDAIQGLYLTKGCDLRASMAELNFWCQMTVGSSQGGLDWFMPDHERQQASADGSIVRIVSKDTFLAGHDLLPEALFDGEDLIRFAHQELGISPLDWVVDTNFGTESPPTLEGLELCESLCEARSALDLLDDSVAPILASKIQDQSSSTGSLAREEIITRYLANFPSAADHLSPYSVLDTLAVLSEEPRIGLPGPPGRKSPSLDTSSTALVTEVAPYIRAIVAHDQQLELFRSEINADGSSQGSNRKQRKTRASRAAQEGTNKALTRRDKWFVEALDFDAVLATGGNWPRPQFAREESSSVLDQPSQVSAVESDELEASFSQNE
ncbi:hypothetical protein PV10_05180 [Exophiala mesophila]|uniref:AAA+ ATPase domain-containing protein n=1 Tax=Exophiala mesophila TaxID=212818 RepID=A0A0D1ZHE5_EXOME|nr:uncharacterized protein PV10_05180 [Exophiala mesophila]KIV94017.1 hypothetical protein PV10_05180 [Exophiala mesophila]